MTRPKSADINRLSILCQFKAKQKECISSTPTAISTIPDFDHNRDDLYETALRAQVICQVVPAVSAESWPRVKRICKKFTGLFSLLRSTSSVYGTTS